MKDKKVCLYIVSFIIITFITLFSSCTHTAIIDNIPEVCFERDVLPVFRNSCAISGCHDGQGESELLLSNYVSISHAVEPGKPFASNVYKAITATSGENRMPPDQPISRENRITIRLWIEQGALLTTCTDTPGQNNGNLNPFACFSRDILPVLVSRCATAGCHDAISHKEDYVFTAYSTTMTAVSPGNPANSKLYQVLKAGGEDKMPPPGRPQLTAAEIDSIASWIRRGALNQVCGEVCDTLNPVTFNGIIWPVIQSSCTGCHSGTSPSGGIALANYSNVAAAAANGILIKSLKGIGVTRMPPGGPLSVCKIRQFEIWVKNGYLNN